MERMAGVIRVGALLACGLGLGALGGCAEPYRAVTLEVSEESGVMGGAQVRAVPLGTGTVPLPVSARALEEYSYAVEWSGVTDARGRVEMRVYQSGAHCVEVLPGALGPLGGRGPWAWVLSADGRTLTRVKDVGEAGSDEVRVRVVR